MRPTLRFICNHSPNGGCAATASSNSALYSSKLWNFGGHVVSSTDSSSLLDENQGIVLLRAAHDGSCARVTRRLREGASHMRSVTHKGRHVRGASHTRGVTHEGRHTRGVTRSTCQSLHVLWIMKYQTTKSWVLEPGKIKQIELGPRMIHFFFSAP